MTKHNLTMGSDPEFFVAYSVKDEQICEPPAIFREFLDADADMSNPKHPVFIRDSGVTVMEDGAAFELTIPPTTDPHTMYDFIQHGISMTRDWLKQFTDPDETNPYNIFVRPVIRFPIERFNPQTLTETLWGAMEFGCDPDDDAIEDDYICEIIDVTTHNWRYGGGHFHLGGGDAEKNLMHENPRPLIQLLACILGNLSIANSPYPDLERARAYHYGQPGRFRLQPHGIEYRSTSNSWIQNKEIVERFFAGSELAFDLLSKPKAGKAFLDEYLPDTIQAIRMADAEVSKDIIHKIGV